MVFTDNTSQYLDLELLAGLPDKLTHSLGKISLQHMVAILGYPDKMVFYFILCMTSWRYSMLRILNQLLAECYPPERRGF